MASIIPKRPNHSSIMAYLNIHLSWYLLTYIYHGISNIHIIHLSFI